MSGYLWAVVGAVLAVIWRCVQMRPRQRAVLVRLEEVITSDCREVKRQEWVVRPRSAWPVCFQVWRKQIEDGTTLFGTRPPRVSVTFDEFRECCEWSLGEGMPYPFDWPPHGWEFDGIPIEAAPE